MVIRTGMAGDYAPRSDNQHQGTNFGGFLNKTMRIAGSGLYKYHRSEAGTLGLSGDALPPGQEFFHVFRPPEVLREHKDMFARVPIIIGRHTPVTTDNAKEHVVGLVGDTVDVEVSKADGETYLYATATIVAKEGVEMYQRHGQVSVGYIPSVRWSKGEYKGMTYDAILEDFKDVNHITICTSARGGPQCMVMDSLDGTSFDPNTQHGGHKMAVFKNLFKSKNKPQMAGDSRVIVLLDSIPIGADPKVQVEAIRAITGDSINDDVWNGYLEDLSTCHDADLDVKRAAVSEVAGYYQQICGDSNSNPDKDDPADANTDPKPGSNGKDSDHNDTAGDADDKDKDPKDTAGDADDKKPVAGDTSAFVAQMDAMSKTIANLTEQVAKLSSPATPEQKVNQGAIGTMNMVMTGDANKPADLSSDSIMKNIYG